MWITKIVWAGAVTTLFGGIVCARDIAGNWQGTVKAGEQQLRAILKIAKGDDGAWKATMFSIDEGGADESIPVDSVRLHGSHLKLSIGAMPSTYQGKISADGASIRGKWRPSRPLPLEFQRATPETTWNNLSPHTVQFVAVDDEVRLEVLDWGGSGRPLLLLAGLGNTAHIFDGFALKLNAAYHVFGITRRGFGASTAPEPGKTNYSADRLGDDVLTVIQALRLNRPVLVGHSIAGEELSSVGSRHPEAVAGLIYLDAGYAYAYYDDSQGDLNIDLVDLQKKLVHLQPGKEPQNPMPLIKELLETVLPGFERDLRKKQKELEAMPAAMLADQASDPMPMAAQAIVAGMQKYTNIPVPILAIFAVPHAPPELIRNDRAATAAFETYDETTTGTQANRFESGVPSARVVRLPHADHNVFESNEADVLREMHAFLGDLH